MLISTRSVGVALGIALLLGTAYVAADNIGRANNQGRPNNLAANGPKFFGESPDPALAARQARRSEIARCPRGAELIAARGEDYAGLDKLL